MLPQRLEKYLTEAERQRVQDARTEGRTEGLATALLQVVEGRGLAMPAAFRERIERESPENLQQMLRRAAVVATLDELFG